MCRVGLGLFYLSRTYAGGQPVRTLVHRRRIRAESHTVMKNRSAAQGVVHIGSERAIQLDRLRGLERGLGARGEDRAGVTRRTIGLTLTTDTARELHVLGHDRHALGVEGAEVGVFEKAHDLRFGRLLEGEDREALETERDRKVVGNLTHKALERQLADEELRGLLLAADLAEGDRAGAEAGLLLEVADRRHGLARRLRREHLARVLTTGVFACSLLGTSHCGEV